MNQCKLEVFKQALARVNIDLLGLSELKGTRMGEFNSDDHLITVGMNPSEEMSGSHSQQKSLKCGTQVPSQK